MIDRAISTLALAGLILAGCQTAAATQPTPATQPASTAPAAYTHDRAVALYRAAKYADCEQLCLTAIAAIEKTKGPKARELAEPLDDLATIYLRLAQFDKAKPVIARAESVLDKSKPADAILLGRLAINKGWRLYSLQEVEAAEKAFDEGRDLIEKNHKGDSVELAELINNLGLIYDDTSDPDHPPAPERVAKARVLLFKAWQMRKKLTGENSPESGESLNNIGMHLLYHAQTDDEIQTAVTTLKKALEVSQKVYGPDHPETAVSLANVAVALKMTDDPDAARQHAAKALAMTEKALGKNHLDRAYELQILGGLDQDAGNYADAEKKFLEALRIHEVTFGPNHPNVANPLEDLRDLYETMGDEAKEKAIADRIHKLIGREI